MVHVTICQLHHAVQHVVQHAIPSRIPHIHCTCRSTDLVMHYMKLGDPRKPPSAQAVLLSHTYIESLEGRRA